MQPTVISKFSDYFQKEAEYLKNEKGFVFEVVAYRKLSSREMLGTFQIWRRQLKKGFPRNKKVTLLTVIGVND